MSDDYKKFKAAAAQASPIYMDKKKTAKKVKRKATCDYACGREARPDLLSLNILKKPYNLVNTIVSEDK